MSQGSRPGGLTAIAIINFVLGGISSVSILATFAVIGLMSQVGDGEVMVSGGVTERDLMVGVLVGVVFSVICVALLIISGVGYLGLKRTMGYRMGNLYAVISIISSVVDLVLSGQGFSILSVVWFIYPLVTLFLLNVVFKEDFVN